MGWGALNLLATVGGVIMALGVAAFLVTALLSLRSGELAGRGSARSSRDRDE